MVSKAACVGSIPATFVIFFPSKTLSIGNPAAPLMSRFKRRSNPKYSIKSTKFKIKREFYFRTGSPLEVNTSNRDSLSNNNSTDSVNYEGRFHRRRVWVPTRSRNGGLPPHNNLLKPALISYKHRWGFSTHKSSNDDTYFRKWTVKNNTLKSIPVINFKSITNKSKKMFINNMMPLKTNYVYNSWRLERLFSIESSIRSRLSNFFYKKVENYNPIITKPLKENKLNKSIYRINSIRKHKSKGDILNKDYENRSNLGILDPDFEMPEGYIFDKDSGLVYKHFKTPEGFTISDEDNSNKKFNRAVYLSRVSSRGSDSLTYLNQNYDTKNEYYYQNTPSLNDFKDFSPANFSLKSIIPFIENPQKCFNSSALAFFLRKKKTPNLSAKFRHGKFSKKIQKTSRHVRLYLAQTPFYRSRLYKNYVDSFSKKKTFKKTQQTLLKTDQEDPSNINVSGGLIDDVFWLSPNPLSMDDFRGVLVNDSQNADNLFELNHPPIEGITGLDSNGTSMSSNKQGTEGLRPQILELIRSKGLNKSRRKLYKPKRIRKSGLFYHLFGNSKQSKSLTQVFKKMFKSSGVSKFSVLNYLHSYPKYLPSSRIISLNNKTLSGAIRSNPYLSSRRGSGLKLPSLHIPGFSYTYSHKSVLIEKWNWSFYSRLLRINTFMEHSDWDYNPF